MRIQKLHFINVDIIITHFNILCHCERNVKQ